MKTYKQFMEEGFAAGQQARNRTAMDKEWDHFRDKLQKKDQKAYDKLRGPRGEAAYHRIVGDGGMYRKGMYESTNLNEAKYAVIMKADGDFNDPDRMKKGKIEYLLNVATGELVPKNPKDYFPSERFGQRDSKPLIRNFVQAGNVVFKSKEEILDLATKDSALANTLKKSYVSIKKI